MLSHNRDDKVPLAGRKNYVTDAIAHLYITWKYLPLFEYVPIFAIKYAAGDVTSKYPIKDNGSNEIKRVGKNYWEGENRFEIINFDQALVNLPGANFEANAPPRLSPVNYLIKFFNPEKDTFEMIRKIMPRAFFKYMEYNPAFISTAYYDPAVSDEKPYIWVARDSMGLSQMEMDKARRFGVDISDSNATFNDEGDINVTGPPPNYKPPLKM